MVGQEDSHIEVVGLGKRTAGRWILKGVDFRVPAGKIFGLLGPNGAGTTACIRILATLDIPDRGEAKIAGLSVNEAADKIRKVIGYVPADSGFYPRLTVSEHLFFYAGIAGLGGSKAWDGPGPLLEMVGLGHRAGDTVDRLSRGQRQLLGVARALVPDPEIILLDEDASGLDPAGQAGFDALIRQLGSAGKTVLVCSHDPARVEALCTWVGILAGGSVAATGPIGEVGDPAAGGLGAAFDRLTATPVDG